MKKIIILITLLVISSCSLKEDCPHYTPPPPTFAFQFIDKNSGDDLLATKKFSLKNIKVTDEKNTEVKFNVVNSKANRVIVILNSIGWNLDKKKYTITLNETAFVKFSLDMDTVEHECYTSFKVDSFEVENYEYNQEKSTGIIQIKM